MRRTQRQPTDRAPAGDDPDPRRWRALAVCIVGGFMGAGAGWRWVFFVNLHGGQLHVGRRMGAAVGIAAVGSVSVPRVA